MQYVIENSRSQWLEFSGKLISQVDSNDEEGKQRYSVFFIYKTSRGNYVGVKHGVSLIEGEKTIITSRVSDNLDDIIKFFGCGRLSQRLFSNIGVSLVKSV